MSAVDEMDRPGGIIPVTVQSILELVAEIKRLREKVEEMDRDLDNAWFEIKEAGERG